MEINKEQVYKKETQELDFELYDEFGFDSEKEDDFDIIENDEYYLESYIVNINKIKQMILDAEKAGATHLQIDYNCDHYSYVIQGSKLTKKIK
jgi:hypothetical protein